MKKVYVIGHKNPDTDSIVSSIAYAALKQELGEKNVFPARGGESKPPDRIYTQRFNVPQPEFVSDLVPRVKHHMSGEPVTRRLAPLYGRRCRCFPATGSG